MPLSPLALQALGGIVLMLFVLWQLSTGLRWIKLGKNRVKIHRRTGITLAVLAVPHMLYGLWMAFGFLGR